MIRRRHAAIGSNFWRRCDSWIMGVTRMPMRMRRIVVRLLRCDRNKPWWEIISMVRGDLWRCHHVTRVTVDRRNNLRRWMNSSSHLSFPMRWWRQFFASCIGFRPRRGPRISRRSNFCFQRFQIWLRLTLSHRSIL